MVQDDELTLTSGRVLYVDRHILGIGPDLGVYYGSDGIIQTASEYASDGGTPLTDEERLELAQIAIARWMRFVSEAN
jgi:hypothetical protein